MTALTGGITPALADPEIDAVEPTTSTIEPPPEAPATTGTTAESATVETTAAATPEPTKASEPVETAVMPTPSVTEPPPPPETTTARAPTAPPETTTARATTAPPETTTARATTAPPETTAPPTTVASSTPTPSSTELETSAVTTTESSAEAETTPQAAESEDETAATVRAVSQVQTLEPELLQAPNEDVAVAKSSRLLEDEPEPAPQAEVDKVSASINLSLIDIGRGESQDRRWDRNVRQWDRDWISYDEYYRPVILNPYRDPVRLVYVYQDAPRVVWIPPLARIALNVAEFAAYSFTAIVLNAVNTAVNVAVGSFFGGGYVPALGLPLPPPPPSVLRYDNVPVQVRYSQAVYEPFRVQRIIDVGDDRVYGERKVLLDGQTPAWGVWTESATGERQFEVHRTQQFPGLDEPREVPLPGDYRLRLAAQESSDLNRTRTILFTLGGIVLALGLGALGWCALLGRRRPPAHR